MEGKLKSLVHKRGYTRGKVTRTYNDIRAYGDTYDKFKTSEVINNLKDYVETLKALDDSILQNNWDDSAADDYNDSTQTQELEAIDEYKGKISSSLIFLEEKLASFNVANVPVYHPPSLSNTSRLKPETAPLPIYGGERNESLEKFIFSFEAITNAHQYSEFEKFLLLQKCMRGRAVILINSLEVDKQSYADAKSLLEEAFAAPLAQRYNTLQRLLDLSLLVNNADPLILVSEMRQIKESFKRLNISVDLVLQFFYWRALPESIKNQLVSITNETKPDLDSIESNVFQAIERDQNLKINLKNNEEPSTSSRRKTNNFAVKVEHEANGDSNKKASIKCTLCSDNHPYFKCVKFKTPSEKVKRLGDLNGCIKCGYINHKSNDCKLSNLKCKLCQGVHFPCLCVKGKVAKVDPHDNVQSNSDAQTVNNIVWTSQADSNVEGLALPTFTAMIGNKTVRIMRDTGAQATLVSEKLAELCKLKVIRSNVSITINGFNGAKDYVTKLVEVPILLNDFSNEFVLLRALCVPNINISLDVPGLGLIVKNLKYKGYLLADELFNEDTNKIDNIDVVLGSDFAYCNPITTKVFGKYKDSTLLMTPVGVMIEGPISKLIKDLDYLNNKELVVNSCQMSKNRDKVFMCNSDDRVSLSDLDTATESILNSQCSLYLESDETVDEVNVEINNKLSNFVLSNASRETDGRLVLPIMWNSNVQHLLAHNYNLSVQILKSNFRKLSNDPLKLKLTDNVFREQESLGIIERIHDFDSFKANNPNYSFLPHMSVFRLNKDTTKCRVVYLSNLAENNNSLPKTLSHNQAIMSGPNLNQKLSTSLLFLKFDKYVLIYDLIKAFLMIAMSASDQARLLLMWYKNVERGDFSIVHYKAKRLPFGISCAPALLMLALYKILIVDDDKSDEKMSHLRRLSYSLLYMDNGGYSSNNLTDLYWARKNLVAIFAEYKFGLQQFVCNNDYMQKEFDLESKESTPEIVNLYGLRWNRVKDSLCTSPISLNPSADTKRLILKSYAENFDIYGYNLPLFNRSKLFIHRLQCEVSLSWDTKISVKLQKEWRLICGQIKNADVQSIDRCVGRREDSYELVAFTDSSKDLYGIVLYMRNLHSGTVSFLLSKNKVVGKNLEGKSIPTLELCAVLFGVETLHNINNELCNDSLLNPVNVVNLILYTDSMIALNWLDGITNKLTKSQNKLSVFVRNRLFKIENLCSKRSVAFNFISGDFNPSDQVTRPISFKQLMKTNFYSGPDFLKNPDKLPNILTVVVPCPAFVVNNLLITERCHGNSFLSEYVDKYSSFGRLVNVFAYVLKFIHKLKRVNCNINTDIKPNFYVQAKMLLIKNDQLLNFPECFDYFSNLSKGVRSMPNIIKQLNVFIDCYGVLRVRSKFEKRLINGAVFEPILLSKNSVLISLIISSLHVTMGHVGKYVVLTELRREFYVPSFFSRVKGVLNKCTLCRRFNAKPVSLNQSPYRLDRLNPPSIPFRFVYLDHFGPYHVKLGGKKIKVYLLLVTCMFSRAFNAEICMDMTVKSFLRSFQMHVHKYGLAAQITSDPGSTLVAGGNLISTFINDESVSTYLAQFNIGKVEFIQFCKGNSSLGGLVESGVKLYKRIIYGFIGNNCMDYHDFEFVISNANHIINKRPIAFLEAARDSSLEEVPEIITAEMLIHGYTLPSINCISGLHPLPDDPVWTQSPSAIIKDSYDQLRKVRDKMYELYEGEFFSKLVHQAVDKNDRYKPKNHSRLSVGDIVCMREKFCKPNSYPLAIVKEITVNDIGEITSARVKRGDTGEVVNRHSTTLVPLLQFDLPDCYDNSDDAQEDVSDSESRDLPKRKAALKASAAITKQLSQQ